MKAESSIWLWTMRDFTVVAAAALISALVFAATKSPMPLAVTGVYGFLTIRFEDVCILDFLGWAVQYFITAQQKFRKELPGKKERKQKEKLPVRELLHIKGFTDHGLDAGEGELVFFSVKPSNISVLSPESIWEKVWRLQTVLASAGEMELLCLDSRESFADNQSHLRGLLRLEENPKVRNVLENDLAHLDSIQMEMATSRQFLFVLRIQKETPDQALAHINRVEKLIADQQFAVRRLQRDDLRKLLALYFHPTAEEEIADGEDFFDRIMPESIDFSVDHYKCGGRYCTAFALQSYPLRTKEQALLARLASQSGVTLHIYSRPVEMVEQRAMIQANTRKNRFQSGAKYRRLPHGGHPGIYEAVVLHPRAPVPVQRGPRGAEGVHRNPADGAQRVRTHPPRGTGPVHLPRGRRALPAGGQSARSQERALRKGRRQVK